MNENNTISSNLTRIKDATDDIRLTLGTPEATIEDVAADVANLSDSYIRMADDYNDLIIENNDLRQQIHDITPRGTLTITENGTYNISSYANVIVSIDEPETYNLTIQLWDTDNDDLVDDNAYGPEFTLYDADGTQLDQLSGASYNTFEDLEPGTYTVAVSAEPLDQSWEPYPDLPTTIECEIIDSDIEETVNVAHEPEPPEPGSFVISVYDENGSLIESNSLEIYNDYEDTSVHTNPYTITDIEPNLEFSIIVNYPNYYTRRVICNSNDGSCDIPLIAISNPEAGKIRVYTRIINPDAESDENLYNLTDISFGNIHPQGATKDNLGYKYIMDVQSGLRGRFSFLGMGDGEGRINVKVSKPNETSWDYGHTSDYLWKGFTNETKNDVIYIQRTDGEASLDVINDLQIEDENYFEFTGITAYKYLNEPLNYSGSRGTQGSYLLTFEYDNEYTGVYKYITPRLDGEIITDRTYLYGVNSGDMDRHVLTLYFDEDERDRITYDIQSGTNVSADILINASEYNLDLGSDSEFYAEYNLCGAIVNDQLIFDNLRISNWEGSKFNDVQLTLQYTDGEQLTLVNQDLWPDEELNLAWDNASGVPKTYTIDSTKEIEAITLTTSEPITYEYDEDNHRDIYWSWEMGDYFSNDVNAAHDNGDLTVEVDGQHEWDSALNEQYYGTYRITWNEWGGWELDSPKAILTIATMEREDGSYSTNVFTITYLDEAKVIDLQVINEATGDLVDYNTVRFLHLEEYNTESLACEWLEYWRNGMVKELSEETTSVHAVCELADPVNWEFVSSNTYALPIEDQYTLIEFIVREKGGNEE